MARSVLRAIPAADDTGASGIDHRPVRPAPHTPAIATRAVACAATDPAGTAALRGVTLRVELGELVALVDVAGAGASSLLRVIAGDLRPSAGSVRVLGSDPFTRLRRLRVVPWRRPVLRCGPAPDVDAARLLRRLRAHADAGRAVLVSTADPRLAAACDRAVILWDGRVVGTVPGGSTAAIERVLADAVLVHTGELPVLLTADG